MHVKAKFLHEDQKETILMQQPSGFEVKEMTIEFVT